MAKLPRDVRGKFCGAPAARRVPTLRPGVCLSRSAPPEGRWRGERFMTPLDRVALFEHDLVVQAGAGTGKTHALVTLYLHLIGGLTDARRRTPPNRILVVTFTDKASGELKERVRARVAQLAASKRIPRAETTLSMAATQLDVSL